MRRIGEAAMTVTTMPRRIREIVKSPSREIDFTTSRLHDFTKDAPIDACDAGTP
jgi:hypothetical protein